MKTITHSNGKPVTREEVAARFEPRVKESQRSEEIREGLREQGFKIFWDVREELTRVSYWHNGAGKALLLLEHAHDLKWESWDLYRPLTSSNSIQDTYAALGEYVKGGD